MTKTSVRAKSIIHNEVRQFSNYANERSIPHIVDGLKPSQRKVVACALAENKQLKVSQLGTKAAERYDYKHGEASIIGTAVGLAQTFPGSNNLPLLEAIGQFGNRLTKAASAPRYIYTKIIPGFYDIFSKEDIAITDYVMDEGVQLEPKYMLPSLPLVLINGATGMGSGFATDIQLHNPKDVAKAVAQAAAGKKLTPLVPWVKGFTGQVNRAADGRIEFIGKWEKKGANELLITELPPKYDLEKYKTVLNDLIERGIIRDYDNESDEDNWRFSVTVPRSFWDSTPDVINNQLKLIQRESQNFVLWDEHDVLQTFPSAEAIVEHWTKHRLLTLAKRRQNTIDELLIQISWLTAKQNFIILWNKKSDRYVKMKKDELKLALAKDGGFTEEHLERLLMLRITSLTLDEVEELEADIAKLLKTKEYYEKITPADIISVELKKFA